MFFFFKKRKDRKEGLWVVVAQSAVQSTKCKFQKFKLCYYQMSWEKSMGLPTGRYAVGVNPVLFLEKKERKMTEKQNNKTQHPLTD